MSPGTFAELRARAVTRLTQHAERSRSTHGAAPEPQTPRELATELLAALFGLTLAEVRQAAHTDRRITHADVARVERALERLDRGMPFAYAVESAGFRHLEMFVDQRVLIPRPETEIVVEHALRVSANTPGGIAADIGTGSGAIALALAQEGTFERVIATDVSQDALDVARYNAERLPLHAPVEFRLGADLAPLRGERIALLVSNPPYVAYHEAAALPASVRDWEPPTALFAADGGQARYRALLEGAPGVLVPGGWLVFECDASRAHETAALAESLGAYQEIAVHDDLTGRPRVLVARC